MLLTIRASTFSPKPISSTGIPAVVGIRGHSVASATMTVAQMNVTVSEWLSTSTRPVIIG